MLRHTILPNSHTHSEFQEPCPAGRYSPRCLESNINHQPRAGDTGQLVGHYLECGQLGFHPGHLYGPSSPGAISETRAMSKPGAPTGVSQKHLTNPAGPLALSPAWAVILTKH